MRRRCINDCRVVNWAGRKGNGWRLAHKGVGQWLGGPGWNEGLLEWKPQQRLHAGREWSGGRMLGCTFWRRCCHWSQETGSDHASWCLLRGTGQAHCKGEAAKLWGSQRRRQGSQGFGGLTRCSGMPGHQGAGRESRKCSWAPRKQAPALGPR